MQISHDGRYLFTVNTGSGSVSSYTINPDGSLTLIGSTPISGCGGSSTAAVPSARKTCPRRPRCCRTAPGTAVLGTNDGFEYGVSAAGKELWRHATRDLSYSSSAVTSGGVAYYGDNSGVLAIASAATGLVRRALDAQPGLDTPAVNIWTAPLVDSAGDVYYGTNGGTVYGYSPRGTQLFAIQTGKTVDSYPALSAAGDLLIGSGSGYLYAIGP